ncbi:hypothetical protein [Shinella lacus]|uniref:ATP dependent DNA ligase n=1 Tax=Shinella lacus TaxID=2654216 RepID=UPI003F6FF7D3
MQSEGFAIVGYERSADGFGGIGRLLLAARQGDGLVHVGGVGTGFSSASATALRKQMDTMAVTSPPIRKDPAGCSSSTDRARMSTSQLINTDSLHRDAPVSTFCCHRRSPGLIRREN